MNRQYFANIWIGSKIKERIDELGVDQKVVAYVAGIDPSNLSRIINGKYNCSINVLNRILTVLDSHLTIVNESEGIHAKMAFVRHKINRDYEILSN